MGRSHFVVAITAMALAGLLGAHAASGQQAPAKDTKVITNPDWERRPTPEQMGGLFPVQALAAGKGGSAIISCTVSVTGFLTDCRIAAEEPEGYGFGGAALAASRMFKMKPQTLNGQPVGGATVNVPVNFRCDQCIAQPISAFDTTRTYFNVNWSAVPSLEQWREAYPPRARARPVDGAVVLQCTFNEGRVRGCEVQEESPRGQGFGAAAQQLARLFVGPTTGGDGKSTNGGFVRLNIAFPAALATGATVEFGRPKLIQAPGPAMIERTFPEQAKANNVGYGEALLRCERQGDGTVANCAVESEYPTGLGFAAAAIEVTRALKYNLWSEDGRLTPTALAVPLKFGDPLSDPRTPESFAKRALDQIKAGDKEAAGRTLAQLTQALDEAEVSSLLEAFAEEARAAQDWNTVVARLTAATIMDPDRAQGWNLVCWEKAIRGIALDSAIADCDKAIALDASALHFRDSRAFLKLRRGEFAASLMDYNASIAGRNSAHSFYGRGIVKMRMGDQAGGQADIRRATNLQANIGDIFAGYGVTP